MEGASKSHLSLNLKGWLLVGSFYSFFEIAVEQENLSICICSKHVIELIDYE